MAYFDNVYFDPAYFTSTVTSTVGISVQGISLPRVELIRRIASLLLGLQPIPSPSAQSAIYFSYVYFDLAYFAAAIAVPHSITQYTRQLATNGDNWEIDGLTDHVTLEKLFALPDNGAIWVIDADRGSFHAIIEVEAAWTADDCGMVAAAVRYFSNVSFDAVYFAATIGIASDSGLLQYTVRLNVTENVFDPSSFDPYTYE
jgi:hypothetical protein